MHTQRSGGTIGTVCPFTYIISYFFKDSNSGQTVILFVYIITVSGLLIAHGIMSVPQLGVTVREWPGLPRRFALPDLPCRTSTTS